MARSQPYREFENGYAPSYVAKGSDRSEMDFGVFSSNSYASFPTEVSRLSDLPSNEALSLGSYSPSRDGRARSSFSYGPAKRMIDLTVALIGIVLLSPILLMTAALIKVETAGPAIFKQRRRGLHGQTFLIWKFRTMSVLEDGPTVAQARRGDARVTRIGSLLRRASIDELPQLVNVIKGEMSLVGPRPHPLALDDKHRETIARYDLRHTVKPGITGWAQINGCRGETSQSSDMQERINCDLWYIRNISLALDLSILFRTLFALMRFEAY